MMAVCNKNCNKCKHLNGKTDSLGYPWGYECLKFGDSVFKEDFENSKTFRDDIIPNDEE